MVQALQSPPHYISEFDKRAVIAPKNTLKIINPSGPVKISAQHANQPSFLNVRRFLILIIFTVTYYTSLRF